MRRYRKGRCRPRKVRPYPRAASAGPLSTRARLLCCVHGAHRLGTVRGHQVDGEHLRRRHTRRGDAGGRELRDAREREGGGGEEVQHDGDRERDGMTRWTGGFVVMTR